jgi:hypothetical protein
MVADSVNFRTMKTQLLEDFDESGSAPGAQPHPAVWRRERHVDVRAPSIPSTPPDAVRDTPAPPGRPIWRPNPAIEPEPARAEPLRVQPHGFAPQPAVLPGGGDPDWLAAHLARDAALNERSEWNGRWTRRLAAWGAAGVVLALLAGGGLWLYEQSQVDGALVVVANTNPAPTAVVARPVTGRDATGLPAVAPVASSVATSATPATPITTQVQAQAATPAVRNATGADATGGLAGASAGASTASSDAENVPDNPPVQSSPENYPRSVAAVNLAQPNATHGAPKRPRSHLRKHPKADTSAAIQDSEPTYRQRREETLMQCRAHGYDERQCFQRGCEMTRFGFACKG